MKPAPSIRSKPTTTPDRPLETYPREPLREPLIGVRAKKERAEALNPDGWTAFKANSIKEMECLRRDKDLRLAAAMPPHDAGHRASWSGPSDCKALTRTGNSPDAWPTDGDAWGRLIEPAVGAHLANTAIGTGISVTYWRERSLEVDFVLQRGDALVAIEVKSGGRKQTLPGIAAFDKAHHPTAKLLVGGQGVPIAEFLQAPASHWLSEKP
jgi:hypothetical protein